MSHELRTLMCGIIGLTRLLADGEMAADQMESLRAILGSAAPLLFLLNDILDFSKSEAGELVLEETAFSLRASLKTIVELLAPVAKKRGLLIRYEYEATAPASVVGDPARINQIITNLQRAEIHR